MQQKYQIGDIVLVNGRRRNKKCCVGIVLNFNTIKYAVNLKDPVVEYELLVSGSPNKTHWVFEWAIKDKIL